MVTWWSSGLTYSVNDGLRRTGVRRGPDGIRVDAQRWICTVWRDGRADDVELVDVASHSGGSMNVRGGLAQTAELREMNYAGDSGRVGRFDQAAASHMTNRLSVLSPLPRGGEDQITDAVIARDSPGDPRALLVSTRWPGVTG